MNINNILETCEASSRGYEMRASPMLALSFVSIPPIQSASNHRPIESPHYLILGFTPHQDTQLLEVLLQLGN